MGVAVDENNIGKVTTAIRAMAGPPQGSMRVRPHGISHGHKRSKHQSRKDMLLPHRFLKRALSGSAL